MIRTSRNVSTFFFWHFHIHARRMCAVKAGCYNENMLWEIMCQMCLLVERCPLSVLDSGTIWWPLGGRRSGAPRWPLGRRRSVGERSSLATCNTILDSGTPCSGEEEMDKLPGLIFVGLLAPNHFPAWWQWLTGSKVEGYRCLRKIGTAAQRECCQPRTRPEPRRKLATAGSQGSEDVWEPEYRSRAWNCPVNAAE